MSEISITSSPGRNERFVHKPDGELDFGARASARSSKDRTLQFVNDPQTWTEAYQSSVDLTCCPVQRVPTLEDIVRNPPRTFKYEPLDHSQPSIRLVHILPMLSPEGLVQCQISHASIQSTYFCLSYVWDILLPRESFGITRDPNERVIMMNGHPLRIRKNLFDFLCMARHNATRTEWSLERLDLQIPFWIDALCIDQMNLKERNHQVAQMGYIYSQASCVHIWLGKAPDWEPNTVFSDYWLPEPDESQDAYFEKMMHLWHTNPESMSIYSGKYHNSYTYDIGSFIFENAYWKRAWVVQEFFLARKLTIWLHTYPSTLQSIRRIKDLQFHYIFRSDPPSDGSGNAAYMEYHDHDADLSPSGDIISLLDKFRDRQCADPRDRVYSLLSLSSTVGVSVDYNITLCGLAHTVLALRTGHLCLCTVSIVMHALLGNNSADYSPTVSSSHVHEQPWIEFSVHHHYGYDSGYRRHLYLSQYVCDRANTSLNSKDWSWGETQDYFTESNIEGHGVLRIPLWRTLTTVWNPSRGLCWRAKLNMGLEVPSSMSGYVRLGWDR